MLQNIGDIIRKASHTLTGKLRRKENNSYDKSPKHYHNNLKINAGINPRARDHPRVTDFTNPSTKELQTTLHEVISIVNKHYELEKKGYTRIFTRCPMDTTTKPRQLHHGPTCTHKPTFTRDPGHIHHKKPLCQSNKPSPTRQSTWT